MTDVAIPPRRALYFLNTTPPPVLTTAQLDALDNDPEGVALVQAILDRKADA